MFILPNKSIPVLESNKFSNKIKSSQDYVEDELTEEWLDNGDFTGNIEPWENETKNDDTGDLNATYSDDHANYEIMGNQGKKEIFANDLSSWSQFSQFQKTDPQLEPDTVGIDSNGAYISHNFRDNNADQTPIVFWRTNVSFDYDMSDYEITSANLEAFISALVDNDIDVEGDYYCDPGDGDVLDQDASYDYTQFFIEISDLEVSTHNTYQIAFTQPPRLGEEASNNYSIGEYIKTKNEEAIKDSIRNVLSVDSGHNNFSLIVGIYIHSADNYHSNDYDSWTDLRFENVNLTFTYEKKINPSSSLSWNQVMNKLPKNTDSVKNATLKFDYVANASWPTTSPNSEFRILVNGSQFRETIKLNDSRTYPKTASFDISSLIPLDYNISLKIQLYIADEFNLNKTIKVSIDNVSLQITYVTKTLESPTNLDLLLNRNPSTSIQIPYGDKINITIIYTNATSSNFISGASVRLRGAGFDTYLENNTDFDHYNITIDSKDLEFGNNYMRIDASKKYFETNTTLFTITVRDRNAKIDKVYYNNNPDSDSEITIPFGQSLDINVTYLDTDANQNITNANVTLWNGTLLLGEFNKTSNEMYNYTLDTSIFSDIGTKFLTVIAELGNHTTATEPLRINLDVRATEYEFYFNGTKMEGDPPYSDSVLNNQLINFTLVYNGTTGEFVQGATVFINGSTISRELTNQPFSENYTTTTPINSSDLNYGSNLFTIYAERPGYEPQSFTLIIYFVQEFTRMNFYVNGTNKTTEAKSKSIIELDPLQINEAYNVTLTYLYRDNLAVEEADVRLTGVRYNESLKYNVHEYGNYSILLNASDEDLDWGVNYLTLTAQRDKYEPQTITLRLIIVVEATNLTLSIDGKDKTSDLENVISINKQWNENIYFNLTYLDSDDKFIDNADVNITGDAYSSEFNEQITYYDETINTADLGLGVIYLTLVAEKTNYAAQTVIFEIEVSKRETLYELSINGQDRTLEKSYSTYWNELITLRLEYNDTSITNLITEANIALNGSGISTLFDNETDSYKLTINSTSLDIGFNYLTITAKKDNYESQTIAISIQVLERQTEFLIILNGVNKTVDNYLEIPINSPLNITVKFIDSQDGGNIGGSTIELVGEGYSEEINKSQNNDQYTIIINTDDLDVGVRFLTISAQKDNYEPLSTSLRINVKRILTKIELTNYNDTALSFTPGQDVPLKVSLKDLDFNKTITNATVRYTWELGQGTMTDEDNDGVYEATIQDVPEGTYTITITVFAGDDYDFERFRITMNVNRPQGETMLYQVLTVVGIASAIGVGGYLIAYQKVLRYPQPVRKIHKYKKKLTKARSLGVSIRSRDEILKELYKDELEPLEREMKGTKKDKLKKSPKTADTQE